MPPTLYRWFSIMVTVRKISSRDQQKMKSRDYMLGSFFSSILSAITDPKDNKALQIKSDP